MVSLFGISEISKSSISFWILYGTLTKLNDIEFKFLLPKYPSNIIYDASVENLLFGSSIISLCISTGIPTLPVLKRVLFLNLTQYGVWIWPYPTISGTGSESVLPMKGVFSKSLSGFSISRWLYFEFLLENIGLYISSRLYGEAWKV